MLYLQLLQMHKKDEKFIFTMYLWARKELEKFIFTNAFIIFTLLCKGESLQSLSILCKDSVKNNLYNFCKDHKLG